MLGSGYLDILACLRMTLLNQVYSHDTCEKYSQMQRQDESLEMYSDSLSSGVSVATPRGKRLANHRGRV